MSVELTAQGENVENYLILCLSVILCVLPAQLCVVLIFLISLLYLLVTERVREGEREQLKAETTGVHGFPKRKWKERSWARRVNEWAGERKGGREHAGWRERESKREKETEWERERVRGRDSHTGCVLIRVHLQEAAEQSVGEVSLRAKESYIS